MSIKFYDYYNREIVNDNYWWVQDILIPAFQKQFKNKVVLTNGNGSDPNVVIGAMDSLGISYKYRIGAKLIVKDLKDRGIVNLSPIVDINNHVYIISKNNFNLLRLTSEELEYKSSFSNFTVAFIG